MHGTESTSTDSLRPPLTPSVPLRPPLVRADGSRLLATDQGLFASSGGDAPFTLVHARDGTWEPDLFEAQGALWGFRERHRPPRKGA